MLLTGKNFTKIVKEADGRRKSRGGNGQSGGEEGRRKKVDHSVAPIKEATGGLRRRRDGRGMRDGRNAKGGWRGERRMPEH